LVHAGARLGTPMNTPLLFSELANKVAYTSTEIADHLLRYALDLDQNRPADDISVVIIRVNSLDSNELIRRLSIQLPIQA
jgi:hypothetical protein